MDMKLEVVIIPVSDVDRAEAFYEKLGFRLDIDYAPNENFRVIQFTPPNSEASIIFGKGITSTKHGLEESLVLAVDNVDAARDDLVGRGVNVSEFFHYAGGPFNNSVENPRVTGREWEQKRAMDIATLAELLRETEERHGQYEKTHAKHDWSDWYAPYLSARQNGSSPEKATAAADRYMEEVSGRTEGTKGTMS
jgi:catechol 2,3-dioxygenase-like lactoylglutathione lyase family enzyme